MAVSKFKISLMKKCAFALVTYSEIRLHFNVQSSKKYIELQNTHIVLFKSPRDVVQVSTLSAQLGLGSKLADCYRDETSLPYGHLLIVLSPRTDDRLRYCTNTGSNPLKFYFPERLKHLKSLDDEQTKSLYTPSVPIVFPQVQTSIP